MLARVRATNHEKQIGRSAAALAEVDCAVSRPRCDDDGRFGKYRFRRMRNGDAVLQRRRLFALARVERVKERGRVDIGVDVFGDA